VSKSIRVVEGIHCPTKKTREQVCKLVACGLGPEEISFVLGCAPHEVRLNYDQELLHGTALVTGMVGANLLKQALRGDVNAARFWLQSRAKWTIPQHVELTGKNGGPVEIETRRKLVARVLELARGSRPADAEGPEAGSSVQ
jgi:hypothetical protein